MNIAPDQPNDHAARHKGLARIPPPFAFVLSIVLGLGLGQRIPIPIVPTSLEGVVHAAGIAFVAFALGIASTCIAQFIRRHTTVLPYGEATALVTNGPYRLSRNPMYVAFTLFCVGVAAFTNVLWPLLFLPAPLLLVATVHIPFEEQTLIRAFGDEYRQYMSRVRRWL